MNDRQLLEDIIARIQAHLTPVIEPPPVESPTGRKPTLLWSEDRQRIFNRMREDGETGSQSLGGIWYRRILTNARGNEYGDSGLWATLAYQMTGDPAFVELAWAKITPMFAGALDDDNNARELASERVLLLDWLWPGLTEERRAQMFVALDRMFTNALTPAIRMGDSDQVTGVYFGFAFYDEAFGDVHQPARDFFALPIMGGLDATARDRSTLRNCISDFVAMADGGEWIESGEYNLGTVRLLMLGATGIGMEHFPEVALWAKRAAIRCALMLTPDKEKSYQWGDEQEPHTLRVWPWSTTAAMFDHPVARKVVYDLVAKNGATGVYSAEPLARAFLLFDPYGAQADQTETIFDARGQGILTARTADSMLCAHFPPTFPIGPVDHAVRYFADPQFYRRGRWALTHPLTYSGLALDGRANNGMLHRGQGSPAEWRGRQTVYAGPSWVFSAGTSGGTILPGKFYQPPPTWWHEWSRFILWIQGDVDTLVIFDRSHVDDPLTLPLSTKYPAATLSAMKANPLRQWRWHMPVRPTLESNTATWAIGDESARVTWLRQDLVPVIVDQAVVWAITPNIKPSEKHFHLELTPPDVAGFQTLITVLEFGDLSKFSSMFGITDGDVQGVEMNGLERRTAWFNAAPGPKLPSAASTGAYNPQVPGLLSSVRFRDLPKPVSGSRVWNMETATGVLTT